jgi:aspartyl aminopeptidase
MARHSLTDALLAYIAASPTPYHAVAEAARQLQAKGSRLIREDESWVFQAGEAVHLVRGGGSLLAFRMPKNLPAAGLDAATSAKALRFHIVGAHTDSPGLKLKPRPSESLQGYRQWGVEIYGGVLLNSWLDRDLGIAGRIVDTANPEAEPLLVDWRSPAVRVPQLAIHLDRQVNEQGLLLNPQRHMLPILGQNGGPSLESRLEAATGKPFASLAFDLYLHDTSPPSYGGLGDEFIYAPRLDNLGMSHAALAAFLAAPAADHAVEVIALFDHEEVGSGSSRGAESPLLAHVLERIAIALGLSREAYLAALPRSFLLSADMAHALHPNYPEKHEPAHFPLMNRGPVLKQNASQRYATDATTAATFMASCRNAGVTQQVFINRADLGCGTTIGPVLASGTGIPTVDVGNAMLSMHSCREMAGADDHPAMVAVMQAALNQPY